MKSLLITGATGGMGSACARLAAERGYNLAISDLNSQKLDALAEECSAFGVAVTCYPLDIADRGLVSDVVASLGANGGLDGIIHTVGLSPQMADWKKVIHVDLVSTVATLEELKTVLKPGGAAVCISSMSAYMVPDSPAIDKILGEPLAADLLDALAALPGAPLCNSGAAYAFSKKALITYVTRQAGAWGREGKRLVSISPGLIQTDMGRLEADADVEGHKSMRQLIALQRDGQPREIASAALFLVSNDASYISGCDLLVDGGFVGGFKNVQEMPVS